MIDATPLLWIYLGLIVAGQGLEILAEQLNAHRISRMRGRSPEALAGWIGAAELDRIERYSTFTPVEDPELRRRILDMAERAGIRIRRIDQMDASLRTRHTNAYFTGLGKTRRIVLFDSLLAAHDHDEVLSILAHEIGHLKRRHIPKHLALTAAAGLAAFAAAGVLIAWPGLYAGFGFSRPAPYVGLFLSGLLLQSLSVFLSPAAAAVSRRFEREADRYALSLTGSSEGLCRALKKMARDNLTNLFPHPLYVALHYSHPPVIERLDHLGCGKPENSEEKMSKLNPCKKTIK